MGLPRASRARTRTPRRCRTSPVYTWDRVPRDADRRLATRVFTPPDIAVEIRSPGQSFRDNLVRCLWYVANGASVSIYADPVERLVAIFRPLAEPIVLVDAGAVDLDDVIPGFTLDVAELFSALIAD